MRRLSSGTPLRKTAPENEGRKGALYRSHTERRSALDLVLQALGLMEARWAARLSRDWSAWTVVERGRFSGSILLLIAGTVSTLVFVVPWALVPLTTVIMIPFSRRCRDSLRWLCYLSSMLNGLALFYVLPLIPASILLALAGLVAPEGVRSGRSSPST